jgi:hypothetical protein
VPPELEQVVGGVLRRHSERAADLPRRRKQSMRRLNLVSAQIIGSRWPKSGEATVTSATMTI